MAGKKYTNEKYENPKAQSDIAKFVEQMNKNVGTNDSLYAFKLTKENFEDAVIVGTSRSDMLKMFLVDEREMDKWCMENYHNMRFKEVYEWCLLIAQREYKSAVLALAQRGNPQALQQAAKFIMDMDNSSTSRVVFVNDIPKKEG